VQRAHASAADWVGCNIKVRSKLQRFGTIHDLVQGLIVNIPERRMEKARADLTRCFDHRGDPRRVAPGCDVLSLAKMGTEVEHDAAQFSG